MTAISLSRAQDAILQMNAVRLAAWGDVDDVRRYQSALLGRDDTIDDETDAALAAFGLRRE